MSDLAQDLDAASLEADAFLNQLQETQKARKQRDPHAETLLQDRAQSRSDVLDALKAVDAGRAGPRRFAPGDTLDIVGAAQFMRDTDPEAYDRLMKVPRKVRKPAAKKPAPGSSLFLAVDQPASFLAVDQASTSLASDQVSTSLASDQASTSLEVDQDVSPLIPRTPPKERWNGVPSAPHGLIDAMSMVSLLEMWRGRPTKEVEAAIVKLQKQDRYSKGAIEAGIPFFRPDPREVKRIINSEWRIDLTLSLIHI